MNLEPLMKTPWACQDYQHLMMVANKESRQLWKNFIEPYARELWEDDDLRDFLKKHDELSLLAPGHGSIYPGFPLERILEMHKDAYPSYVECLAETLKYYVSRNLLFSISMDYGLDVAIASGIINPELPHKEQCVMCGQCCIGIGPAVTPRDNDRILSFLKDKAVDPLLWKTEGESEVTSNLEELITWIDFIAEGLKDSSGEMIHILACPFLERLNSEKCMCIIDPVKPKYCKRHYCWMSPEEMRENAEDKEEDVDAGQL